jgi:DNA-binding LacI/PurR family transcriptional regulator
MNYRPNLMASSLRTVVSRLLAVISDTSVTEPYGGDLTRGCRGGRGSGSHPYPRRSATAT